ncbi:hypothetical protein [Nocardiopsis alba]|uniref:hypothetical protein n=1 Tax=Nocardiopsis alba TaxID=53437 RepID=UPI0033BA9C20
MSLITVVVMVGGLVTTWLVRRSRRALARLLLDERAGRVGPAEAARLRFEHVRRSFLVGRAACGLLAVLIVAVVGRAVSGSWGAATGYYVAAFGALLLAGLVMLWRVHGDLRRSRAALEG